MNLQDIVSNFRNFKHNVAKDWGSPLTSILKALFEERIPLDYDSDFDSLVDPARISIYTLFDLAHHSDEACELHVLALDDKPLGVAYKFGDRSDWHSSIIDAELYKTLAREIAAAAMEHRLTKVTAEPLVSLGSLNNGYLFLLDKAETMFAVRSPKACYGFSNLPKTHRCFFVNDAGQPLAVESIGAFCNQKLSHDSDIDAHEVTVTIDGEVRQVDGMQLMFEMVPGQGQVTAALESYSNAPAWYVKAVNERAKIATVLLRLPNRWSTSSAYTEFETLAEFQRFAAKYFHEHTSSDSSIVPGEFCPVTLGFKGKINVVFH
jgi:hypothetical protein